MEETLNIQRHTYGTRCAATRADGKTVLVEGAVAGDVARVAIDAEKARYALGHVVEVLEASPDRVAGACPLSGTCGGCPWMALAYPAQLAAKRANIVSALVRGAKFAPEAAESLVEECRPSKRELGYRNKLELACTTGADGRLVVGMHAHGSTTIVPVERCPLGAKALQGAPKALQGALRYCQGALPDGLGISRIGVRASMRTKSLEVALWTQPGAFPRAQVAKVLASALRPTSCVRVLEKPGAKRAIRGTEVLAGSGCWHESLGGFDYYVSAPSFFQVNTAQAEVLVDLVVQGVQASEGARVADLYSGVGTFTLALADTDADVVAVESAGSAVRDLRRNAEEAGLWIDVLGGDSARELPQLGELDALVVDPPRAGLAAGVAESIAAAHPSVLAYVSCDPATWARDVARLRQNGYKLMRAVPVDLFPQSYHCEVASFFEPA